MSIEEQIDNAIRDCAVSADAMRWTPEPVEPAPQLPADGILRVEFERPGMWWHRWTRRSTR